YAILQGTLANANYDITFVNGILEITPKAITVTANVHERVYGSSDPALTWQIAPGELVGDDELSGALVREEGETVGEYAILQGTLERKSDEKGNGNGILEITPKPITVTANELEKVYGSSDPALTWELAPGELVGDDTLDGALEREEGETVGEYAILQGTLANANYDIERESVVQEES